MPTSPLNLDSKPDLGRISTSGTSSPSTRAAIRKKAAPEAAFLSWTTGIPRLAAVMVLSSAGTSPTLDIVVQNKIDGAYHTVGTFAQKVTTGLETITLDGYSKTMRIVFTIGGSAGQSFTFTVVAHKY